MHKDTKKNPIRIIYLHLRVASLAVRFTQQICGTQCGGYWAFLVWRRAKWAKMAESVAPATKVMAVL